MTAVITTTCMYHLSVCVFVGHYRFHSAKADLGPSHPIEASEKQVGVADVLVPMFIASLTLGVCLNPVCSEQGSTGL